MFNARSVKNKLPELHYFLNELKPDILCITETWLNDNIPDSLITGDSNYAVFRRDRPGGTAVQGGGVCILTNNDSVSAVSLTLPVKFNTLELCGIDVLLSGGNSVRIINFYRPPGVSNRNPNDVSLMSLFSECIDYVMPVNATVILCGDFNMPSIDWTSSNLTLHCCTGTCTGLLLELYLKHGLHQFITTATRDTNTLDLLFTNDPCCITDVNVDTPFSSSDHNSLYFNFIYRSDCFSSDIMHSFYNFNKADWDRIRCHLSTFDFNILFETCSSPDEVFDCFYNVLYECLNLFVPLKTVKRNSRPRRKYPRKIRKLQSKKASAWRVYRRCKTDSSRSAYKSLATKCRAAIHSYVTESETQLVDNANLGAFYRYANRRLASRSSMGPLTDSSGNMVTDSTSKANLLNHVFCSYFSIDNSVLPSSFPYSTSSSLSEIIFTPVAVERTVKKLSVKTRGGRMASSPVFLKNCICELRAPLAELFAISFQCGYLPEVWRHANITPIFKKGTRTDPNNYRPVAFTATMCKIMAAIIKNQLMTDNS